MASTCKVGGGVGRSMALNERVCCLAGGGAEGISWGVPLINLTVVAGGDSSCATGQNKIGELAGL